MLYHDSCVDYAILGRRDKLLKRKELIQMKSYAANNYLIL